MQDDGGKSQGRARINTYIHGCACFLWFVCKSVCALITFLKALQYAVADPGGDEGAMAPPGPLKISHKKDGSQIWPHRLHVSRHLLYPATGSATDTSVKTCLMKNS